MLNLVQHLIIPKTYETLKQVQGDKTAIATQTPREEKPIPPYYKEGVREDYSFRGLSFFPTSLGSMFPGPPQSGI